MSSTIPTIKVAAKPHRCSWCGEKIDAGSSYVRWRYFGDIDPVTCKLHPECNDAFGRDSECEFEQHQQPRGKTFPEEENEQITEMRGCS